MLQNNKRMFAVADQVNTNVLPVNLLLFAVFFSLFRLAPLRSPALALCLSQQSDLLSFGGASIVAQKIGTKRIDDLFRPT